jgi:hypothetical protein
VSASGWFVYRGITRLQTVTKQKKKCYPRGCDGVTIIHYVTSQRHVILRTTVLKPCVTIDALRVQKSVFGMLTATKRYNTTFGWRKCRTNHKRTELALNFYAISVVTHRNTKLSQNHQNTNYKYTSYKMNTRYFNYYIY